MFRIVFNLAYSFALLLLFLISLPKAFYLLLRHGKYRGSILQRLGFGFPRIEKDGKQVIWIHAVSVGETKAAAPLIQKIKVHDPQAIIVVSNITETGHAEALRSIPSAHYHLYLPLDFSWALRPVLARINPDLVLLTESDFWHNFCVWLRSKGLPLL